MGNCLQKKKFLVKNKTEYQIFFKVTENKINLDVEDIRPGKVVRDTMKAPELTRFDFLFRWKFTQTLAY